MKKVTALLLAIVMVLGLGTMAWLTHLLLKRRMRKLQNWRW